MRSTADLIASLPPRERQKVLEGFSPEFLSTSWRFWARPNQLAPDWDWQTWLVLAGRGFGKTRTGAEWVREQVKLGRGRIALIAPTASDARDVMIEGESGLLGICWAGDRTYDGAELGRPEYEPSKRRLTWQNGAQATSFSAEEPERLRGPQHDAGWCDELAAWKYLRDTWDMYVFGLRLGDNPRTCITTTPKPLRLLRELIADDGTAVTRGSTYDNKANLAGPFLSRIVKKYEGTRLGRQELNAELLEEAEGALWSRDTIEENRIDAAPEDLARIVVAIDPAVTDKEASAETGLVSAGIAYDGTIYVLADRSDRLSPNAWATAAIEDYRRFSADRIVAEGNQGGDLVKHTIHTIDPRVPVTIVHAHRGKAARAEPVAALYEQGRVKHAGTFPDLEDQMVNWEPLSGSASPDRLDALVWAVTALANTLIKRKVFETPMFSLLMAPVKLPDFFTKALAVAISADRLACLWGAWDQSGVCHVFGEYVTHRTVDAVHASAIKARGGWIPGVLIMAKGASEKTGKDTRLALRREGITIRPAQQSRDVLLPAARQAIELGMVKVFSNLRETAAAYENYVLNQDGRPEEDNLVMDAFCALIANKSLATTRPEDRQTRTSETPMAGY